MEDNKYNNIKNAGVSVIICCYNSAARLPQTLKHLAEQKVPTNFAWEIIIVNNASTDNTTSLAKEIWNAENVSGVDLKVIDEPNPGLAHARNSGVKECTYECIIFCDDDNWLHENYVYLAKKMTDASTSFGAGGGLNIPATDAQEYPDWFATYKDKYALGTPTEKSGEVSLKGFVLGAGMVTKKSLFLLMNDQKYPSILTGRNGQQLTSGEDFEYCKRLLLRGYKLYYEEEMKLTHFIPKERLTIDYREKLMTGIMQAGKVLYEYDLAIQIIRKTKGKSRWRLFLMAPFRVFFASIRLTNRNLAEEQLKLFYLSPFGPKGNSTKNFIKKFYYNQ